MGNTTQKKSERLARPREAGAAEEERPVRAALYARVSSEEQAKEGYSIDNQVDRLKHNAVAKGWVVAGIYVDAGESGRYVQNRAEYLRMMEEREKWDTISIMKMDRIHRSQKNFIAMIDSLAKWGKDFQSITESLDTATAMGRFVMGIAQLESEQTGERTSTALGAAFRLAGKRSLGQQAPFGYVWNGGGFAKGSQTVPCPDCKKKAPCERHLKWGMGELVPDQRVVELQGERRMTRAETVRLIYEMSAEGSGVSMIARVFDWCDCRAKSWGEKSNCSGCLRVRYILNNPFYAGFQLYQGQILPAKHKPLITRAMFEAVQARRRLYRVSLPPEAA